MDYMLIYWDIKSNIGMKRLEQARRQVEAHRNVLSDQQLQHLECLLSVKA